MSMRSQVYEWDASRGTTMNPSTYVGQRVSIFVGGVGNNITKPAETTATEFVVIEDIAVTPSLGVHGAIADNTDIRGLLVDGTTGTGAFAGPRAYVQVRINTTDYFLDPDNIPNDGIPGAASPYPRSINFQPSFNLYPDVYVLPGQTFQILYSNTGTTTDSTEIVSCFLKYTLYDGPDALIANKLLELGVTINPNNVDWYKRSLIEQQQRSRAVAGGQA